MKIDGKLIAQKILENLAETIKKSHLHPTLLVIQVGENPASLSYIRQKQKAALFIGAKIINKNLPENTSAKNLIKLIGEANKDKHIHGIIVQLPLPSAALGEGGPTLEKIINHIVPSKDVDGFTPDSPFIPPVAGAVLKVLSTIPGINISKDINSRNLMQSIPGIGEKTDLNFLVIGRGITAGKPIAETLKKIGYNVTIAHSQTKLNQFVKLVHSADVIISCVGKPNVIKAEMLKPGCITIGVGLHREPMHLPGEKPTEARAGAPPAGGGNTWKVNEIKVRLVGDFNEEEVSRVASFYTSTPGGIGPINVASLMENLVKTSLMNHQREDE